MDVNKSLEEHILGQRKLEGLMIKNYPVVPPDSIIRTFSHLRADNVDLIVSQDRSGLVAGSVIVRNSEWSKFFIETWMDPLYRSYNFQKAERHALVSEAENKQMGRREEGRTNAGNTGTYCSMAPHHPLEAGARASAHTRPVHAHRPRRCIPRRRLCGLLLGLCQVRPGQLRNRIVKLLQEMELGFRQLNGEQAFHLFTRRKKKYHRKRRGLGGKIWAKKIY